MPPVVGAVAMQLIFGRSGSVNLLLNDWFGFTIPFMEGLNGVIFVEALHYFPFILMNLVVALRNIDGAMEEAAFNLGSRGFRLFRRVIFPLAVRRPGHAIGAGHDQHAGPAGLSAHHAGGAGRPAGVCDQRDHDRVLDPGAVAVGARAQGPRLLHPAKGRQLHPETQAAPGGKRLGLWVDHPGADAGAVAAHGRAAVVTGQRLELRSAA
ncbi:hypothetical protein G6F65_019616 [Rhizopus arrhizus]|nr:hypothetical protein G6F65_019616 [Rhizopus arrhizus]